jgi:cytochrome c oxidase subunit 2
MKKAALLIGTAVVSMSLLAGCGGDQATSDNKASNTQPSSGQTSSTPAYNVKEVNVEGSNYEIKVSPVEIKAGEKVKLTFTTKEGVHGYAIKNADVKADSVVSGSSKSIEWTPEKPGEYEVYCTLLCGPADKHGAMKTTIKVN